MQNATFDICCGLRDAKHMFFCLQSAQVEQQHADKSLSGRKNPQVKAGETQAQTPEAG